MPAAVTHGIQVSARARYEEAHSDPKAGRFLFSYRITITNRSERTVQLLRRHWWISDSLAAPREVEGPGVIGEQPVLPPGESFTYSSACDLRSGLGRMRGTYLMRRVGGDESRFEVEVPELQLAWPLVLN